MLQPSFCSSLSFVHLPAPAGRLSRVDFDLLRSQLRLDHVLLGHHVLAENDPLPDEDLLPHDQPLLEERDRDRPVVERLDLGRVVVVCGVPLEVGVLVRKLDARPHVLRLDALSSTHGSDDALRRPDAELFLASDERAAALGGIRASSHPCPPPVRRGGAGARRAPPPRSPGQRSASPSTATRSLRTSSVTVSVSVRTSFSSPMRSLATVCFWATTSSPRSGTSISSVPISAPLTGWSIASRVTYAVSCWTSTCSCTGSVSTHLRSRA